MIFRFKLTYSGEDTTVIEPKGWDTFKSEIKRDFKSHGVIFKYTSGTLKLGFADGRSVLETAFRNDGYDAIVVFTVDQRNTDTDAWVNAFTGNAVMKNRELDEDYFNVDFEASTFQQKVISRLDTKVRLDTVIDLDGGALASSLTDYLAAWNHIRLKTEWVTDYRQGADDTSFVTFTGQDIAVVGQDAKLHSTFDFQGAIIKDLDFFQFGANETTNGTVPTASIANFVFQEGGTFNFSGTTKHRVQTTVTLNVGASNAEVEYELRLRHFDPTGSFIADISAGGLHQSDAASPYVRDSGVTTSILSGTLTVAVGDQVVFYWRFLGRSKVFDNTEETTLDLDALHLYHNTQITYNIQIDAGTSNVKSSLIHDVINRMLYIVTGQNNRLNSTFLGLTQHGYTADGCGGLTHLVNGEQLRGIPSTLNLSLKDVLDSIQAIWGLGWGFEKNYKGEYDLRIEPLEHFYQDGEILDLGNPISIKEGGSYKETIFDPLALNRVEIGYTKFSDDEDFSDSIEDFLTMAEYSLPVTSVDGVYSQKSKLITSGRLIQATFEQTDTSKKWKLDQNVFLVAVVRSASVFIPENDENFTTVNGLDDKTTAYNIRHAPVYMFLNHALIVNSSLMGKTFTDLIQNTSVEVSQTFEAQFNNYEQCLLGDIQRLLRTSSGDIAIENNFAGLRLFAPIQHELTVAMTKTQLDLIIDNMENNGSDNYGYLTYRDNEGAVQTGYPLVITWNPNDEIAQIETLEKADNYGI